MPKAINAAQRLKVTVTGVIVHGIGSFVFTSTDAQSSGCDLTIEVLYRLLQMLQSMGYRFPGKAYFYGDNHTDIKTPAMLFFLAYLVRIGVFTHAEACFLLVGHSHLDIDQFFSVLSRYLHSKQALAISVTRFLASLREAFKREEMKPTVIEVDSVRGGRHGWRQVWRLLTCIGLPAPRPVEMPSISIAFTTLLPAEFRQWFLPTSNMHRLLKFTLGA